MTGVLRAVEQPPTRPPTVLIAVLTYRRPDDLAALLPQLIQQASGAGRDTSVLVVDNDPAASARAACTGYHPAVRYVHEPRPGIAAARSRALREAGRHDVLIFIDDDERPSGPWLRSLRARSLRVIS